MAGSCAVVMEAKKSNDKRLPAKEKQNEIIMLVDAMLR